MITKDKHQKHPPLKRPNLGVYHRNEWAIYGTTCAQIETFYKDIVGELKDYNSSYVDGDHSHGKETCRLQIGEKIFQMDKSHSWNSFDDKFSLYASDLVFVNGNHFPASRQIVIIDLNKRDSLERRKDQLDNIDVVIVKESEVEIFDFVKERMSSDTLVLKEVQKEAVANHIKHQLSEKTPKLKALVLAGGKSIRMGVDKSLIDYHQGVSQQVYMAHMCQDLGLETYISKGHDFDATELSGFPVIADKLVKMGPYGGILSAFITDPEAAWLVVACDLPFLDKQTLKRLISSRSIGDYATSFEQSDGRFPEPLIAIYEPRIYPRMLSFLSLGYACPRKVLINSEVHILKLENQMSAMNVNTPEEMRMAKLKIEK